MREALTTPAAADYILRRIGGAKRVCNRRAVEAFQRAIETGDLQDLLDQLAPDVVLLGDGGGIKQTAVRPIVGADQVARFLADGLPRIGGKASVEPVQINGGPALSFGSTGRSNTSWRFGPTTV